MAVPTVISTAKSQDGLLVTTHTLNLPAGIQSGDLLLAIVATVVAPSFPADWSNLGGSTTKFYHNCDGTEGASITYTSSSSSNNTAVCYLIRQADLNTPPEKGSVAPTLDPPSLSPSWGTAADTLWIATVVYFKASTNLTVTGSPTGFSNLQSQLSSVPGNPCIGTVQLNLNASSEDPSTWTLSGTPDSVLSDTLAVKAIGGFGPFLGTGSLSVSASAVLPVTAALAGAGNLSALIFSSLPAFESLTGTGRLSTNANVFHFVTRAFSGAGSLSSHLEKFNFANPAEFDGAGSLSATTIANLRIATRFGGAGSLEIRTPSALSAFVTLPGVGSLSSHLEKFNFTNPAEFDGAGKVSANSKVFSFTNPAEFDGAGSLSSHLEKFNFVNPARFVGAGNVSVYAALNLKSNSGFAGAGNLLILTPAQLSGVATLLGAGSLSSHLEKFNFTNPAEFDGAGKVSVNPRIFNFTNPAEFDGAGSLLAVAGLKVRSNIRLGGAGGVLAVAGVVSGNVNTSLLAGSGSLSANALRFIYLNSQFFSGASDLSGLGTLLESANALFSGNSSLEIDFDHFPAGWQGLAGAGSLSATMLTFMFDVTAVLPGGSGLSAYANTEAVIRGHLAGAGSFGADTIVNNIALSKLPGVGGMYAYATVRIGPRGVTQNVVVDGPGPVNNVVI